MSLGERCLFFVLEGPKLFVMLFNFYLILMHSIISGVENIFVANMSSYDEVMLLIQMNR